MFAGIIFYCIFVNIIIACNMTKTELILLEALCDMWYQYCSNGHCFMSAGENCEDILIEYGLLTNKSVKINYNRLELLQNFYDN